MDGFDLAIVDEAHSTAGDLGRPWATIHDNARIPADFRLYLTATPASSPHPSRRAGRTVRNWRAITLRRGIGSIDYFDRYMVFGIPDDDLPEHIFDTALHQLADGNPGTEAAELLLRLRDDTQRITRRIQYKRASSAPLPAAALLEAAAQQYGHLTATPQGVFGLFTANRAMDILASDLPTDLAEPERPVILKTMAETPDGAVLSARTLQGVATRAGSDGPDQAQAAPTPDWISEARSLISH